MNDTGINFILKWLDRFAQVDWRKKLQMIGSVVVVLAVMAIWIWAEGL